MENPMENSKIAKEKNTSQRAGWMMIAALTLITLSGHLANRYIGATPMIPSDDFSSAGVGTPALEFAGPGGTSVTFTGKLDRNAVLRGGDGLVKMELVLAAEERAAIHSTRTPTDFVIVFDRSGSMDGIKIEQARAAVRELISQLSAQDRFSLVVYGSGASVPIPLSAASPETRQRWRQIVDGISAGGGTNMSGGLDLALATAAERQTGRATRMILISDGLANEGDASIEGLTVRVRRVAGREAVLSTVGVGEDFNEFLMSQVADAGTGNYYFIKDTERLAQVFSDEFAASRGTVATALAVTIEPTNGVRVIEAAGYPLKHANGKTSFQPGSLFSGQERRIWVTLEVPNGAEREVSLGTFTATFKDHGQSHVVGFTDTPVVACVTEEDSYHDSFDKETWARSVAEEDYNSLQQRVAGYVKEGRQEDALKEIGDFRIQNESLNRVMRQEAISKKLEELQSLHSEVEGAFQGADQAHKQNQLSKARQYSGRDGRRAGSKKAASTPNGGP